MASSAKSIMVAGTASHVGKSWMATAICRVLRRRGIRVAPFKAQNMSNNSYPCAGGGEIGRAQVAQAEACGLAPHPDMNPVLLKPYSDRGSQVVVDGKVWRNLAARELYEHSAFLRERVLAAYSRLAARSDYIVLEGAGSISEINLKRTDLVNLGLARELGTPVLLVADIDRGGVFASIVGSFALLDDDESKLVRSFAVNRFRGDPSLFDEGVTFLEGRTGRRCLGVFPYAHDIRIDEEDGVVLDLAEKHPGARVAILRFPRISNLTDFRLLTDAAIIDTPAERQFDCVILPGSKNTIGDLAWMRSRGLDRWVVDQHAGGARIVGVCGGYQMLGRRIEDPHHVESESDAADGLGLLPVTTVLTREKTTCVVDAVTPGGAPFQAYEIHMGETERPPDAAPFALIAAPGIHADGGPEGMRLGRVFGTYLHGALESPAVLREFLNIEVAEPPSKDAVYDRLADWFEANADMRVFEDLFL